MKKTLFLFILMALPMMASAVKVEIGGLWYSLNTIVNTASVTRPQMSSYYSGDIVIPATVNYENTEYSVSSIEGNAFYNCTGLTSVTIPGSVKEMGTIYLLAVNILICI